MPKSNPPIPPPPSKPPKADGRDYLLGQAGRPISATSDDFSPSQSTHSPRPASAGQDVFSDPSTRRRFEPSASPDFQSRQTTAAQINGTFATATTDDRRSGDTGTTTTGRTATSGGGGGGGGADPASFGTALGQSTLGVFEPVVSARTLYTSANNFGVDVVPEDHPDDPYSPTVLRPEEQSAHPALQSGRQSDDVGDSFPRREGGIQSTSSGGTLPPGRPSNQGYPNVPNPNFPNPNVPNHGAHRPPNDLGDPLLAAVSNHHGAWSTGVCHCWNDVPSCCDVYFCGPCQLSRQYNMLNRRSNDMDIAICFCIMLSDLVGPGCGSRVASINIRSNLRRRYNIPGTMIGDVALGCCLFHCVACQHYREMSVRGEWTSGCCVGVPFGGVGVQHAPVVPAMY